MGKECDCFLEQYAVDKYKGSWVPRFNQTSTYCTHPSVYERTGKLSDTGIPLRSLKTCPKNK